MTFSLTARCPETGMFGIVISSSSPAVAARCVHVRAKVGAVASQNITDPGLGQIGLDLLARGLSATQVRDTLVASTRFIAFRQLAMVDATGGVASYSGSGTLGIHATCIGEAAVATGNLLANDQVPAAMIAAYQAASGSPFADRLLAALAAGLDQGGEAGPVHSAGLYVVREMSWPIVGRLQAPTRRLRSARAATDRRSWLRGGRRERDLIDRYLGFAAMILLHSRPRSEIARVRS
jgi:uncharacterized Ntn-hydrolase superfamily protein